MQSTFTEKIQFVEKTFGKGVLSRSGDDIAVACPVCKDSKKKKLSISLTNWSFHCWVCGEKGKTLIPILRKTKSKETTDYYRSNFLNQAIVSTSDEPQEKKFEYPEGFVPLVSLLDSSSPNTRSVLKYLSSRGITNGDMYRYRIGVSPIGRDPRRIFFISLDSEGEENYFVSRAIDDKSRIRYVNSEVDKSTIIFNECDINWDEPIFLVEGVFDQIRLNQNSAVLLGSTLAESSLLFRKLVLNESHVILALDADAQQKSVKIANSLAAYGCKVQIMPLLGCKDLGSMTQQEIQESMSQIYDWSQRESLLSKISLIRSGSML